MTEKEQRKIANKQLYQKWRRVRKLGCCDEWLDFDQFLKWAKKSGFAADGCLKRHNNSKPYSPRNCYWLECAKTNPSYAKDEFCERWNNTVNRIRDHYGMAPLEVDNGQPG